VNRVSERMFRDSTGWLERPHALSGLVGGQVCSWPFRTEGGQDCHPRCANEEGRKLIAQAHKAATSSESRRLMEQVKRVGKTAGQAVTSPAKRTPLDTVRGRLRPPHT
jgi:hypothetical protein